MAYESEYAASGHNRTITAFFDSRSDASRAIDNLVVAGIPRDRITMVAGDSESHAPAAEREEGGFWEALANFFMPDEDRYAYAEGLRRGGYLVTVRTDTTHYDRALDILDDEGSIDMDEREGAWRAEGWRGYEGRLGRGSTGSWQEAGHPSAANYSTSAGMGQQMQKMYRDEDHMGGDVIPVAEEELKVGKRDVSHGRVRVRSYVVEEPVSESVTLRDERVDVERRPADRAATGADGLFQERTVEMEEHGEEAVVAKDVRVTEEVGLRKEVDQRTETVSDTVRHTEVEIEDDRDAPGHRRDR